VLTSDEIGGDELLFRKISVKSEWYDPIRNEIKPEAFKPWPRDIRGISFDRAQSDEHPDFRRIEEAARGPSVKGYYVAVLRAGDLRSFKFDIEPDPLPDNPGHALITNLTYASKMDAQSIDMMAILAHMLVSEIQGPF
jgi:hypothetical protein